MSGRRARALRKGFRVATGRPPIRREQRWLKTFYEQHKSMSFGLRRIAPPSMSLWERAERLPVDSQQQPLTDSVPTSNVDAG